MRGAIVLDLGCGPHKLPGSIGIDNTPFPGVNVIADLNRADWPIKSGSVDAVRGNQIMEHVDDVLGFLTLRTVHCLQPA
jgi:hypothetical protein